MGPAVCARNLEHARLVREDTLCRESMPPRRAALAGLKSLAASAALEFIDWFDRRAIALCQLTRRYPPTPWRSFLRDFDTRLKGAVALLCLGGFVVTQQYGIGRGTSDIDFLSVTAVSAEDNVEVLGGLGSDLYKKYRVYRQYVGIASALPEPATSTAVY
jgi:hypothetical protein